MARIRMVKPEFFDDPNIGELSPLARLFFIGLWTQADREGRLADDVRRLKVRIFPFDDVDVEALAVELHGKDMIRRYQDSNGNGYIWIRSFIKHQRPHPKEPASVIPAYSSSAVEKHGEPCKETASPQTNGTRNLDSGTRKLEADAASPLGPPSSAGARSKRPIFQSTRFVVFEWMFDDLRKLLGPHFESFGLDEWFHELALKADAAELVVPQRDGGKWLCEQTMAEAVRRGLAVATVQPGTGRTAANAANMTRFAVKGAR